ncbi:hypothetical protein BH23PLA1_BH23PLA1_12970 [soil metagenome]
MTRPRAETGLLLAGGLLLFALMGYTLWIDGDLTSPRPVGPEIGADEVAVFFPNRNEWLEFRIGLNACVRRGMAHVVSESPESILIETKRNQHPIQFTWQGSGGVVGMRTEVDQLFERAPPVAVIGSNNTVQTVALAEALNQAVGPEPGQEQKQGPVLLAPWATAVTVKRADGLTVPLLKIYPGRTFRFCPNNRQVAEMLVRCLVGREAVTPPGQVVLVVDRSDPYSRDLAEGFAAAIAETLPAVAVERRNADLSAPGPLGQADTPGPVERAEAGAIWGLVREASADQPVWVVLPLQGRLTRRMINALRERARSTDPGLADRLRVLSGDGVGRDTLARLAGDCEFPVDTVSPAAMPDRASPSLDEAGATAHVSAEIVSALVQAFDQSPGEATGLRSALLALNIPADAPGAFGRSLAFEPTGERRGSDLGHVLSIRPGTAKVWAFAPGTDGRWSGIVAYPTPALAQR